MKYTKVPENIFKEIQLNAGVLLNSFTPSTGAVTNTNILGATSGGIKFEATPSFKDFGEDIDNCPKNTKELKKLEDWEVKMSGSFVTVNAASAKSMVGAADSTTTGGVAKITPRRDLLNGDFADVWLVGDYSDKNGDTNGGFIAIHLLNSLSTGGFVMTTTDKEKGKFDFEFTGHYSINAPDTVPFEVYVKAGTEEAASPKA